MTKQLLRIGMLCVLMFVAMLSQAQTGFNTIQVDLTGDLVNTDEKTEGTQLSFGVAVATDGTQTRVSADDASASIVLTGIWHDAQHGWTKAKAKVKVNGPVKIGFGNCSYGKHIVNVNDENGNTLLSGDTEAVCWDKKTPTEKVTYLVYKGEAATLELVGAEYTPYFSVEAVDPSTLGSDAVIKFDITNAGAEGTAPADIKAEVGSDITVPLNKTLYKEGATLTAWSDGTNSYQVGDVIPYYEDGVFRPFYLGKGWNNVSTRDHLRFYDVYATSIHGGTGSIVKVDGVYHAFYCQFSDKPYPRQYACHAVSADLREWTDLPEDTFQPDDMIYEMSDWRDPHVVWIEEDNCWWMLLAATLSWHRKGLFISTKSTRHPVKAKALQFRRIHPMNLCSRLS